jgi:hypothetical protein
VTGEDDGETEDWSVVSHGVAGYGHRACEELIDAERLTGSHHSRSCSPVTVRAWVTP